MARKIAAFILCLICIGWTVPVKTTFSSPDSPQYAVPAVHDKASLAYACEDEVHLEAEMKPPLTASLAYACEDEVHLEAEMKPPLTASFAYACEDEETPDSIEATEERHQQLKTVEPADNQEGRPETEIIVIPQNEYNQDKEPDTETIAIPESERRQENFEIPPETDEIIMPDDFDDSNDADDSGDPDETANQDDMTDAVQTPEPDIEPEPEHNMITEVKLGYHEPVKAIPGQAVTLAFPVQVVDGEDTYDSNRSAEGRIIPYHTGLSYEEFDQTVAGWLKQVSVQLDIQAIDSPFDTGVVLPAASGVVDGGKNKGYAVFGPLQISHQAYPGEYTLNISVLYDGAEQQSQWTLTVAEAGDVSLAAYQAPMGSIGGTMTLAIPLRYTNGSLVCETNRDEYGNVLPYSQNTGSAAYHQQVAEELDTLYVQIASNQQQDFPLDMSAPHARQDVIAEGEGANRGYAVFDQLRVLSGAEPGEYDMRLDVIWQDNTGVTRSKQLTVPFNIIYGDSVIVFTWAELEDAVSNASGPSTIYLGWCTGMTGQGDGWEPGATVNNGTIYMTNGGASNGAAHAVTISRSGVTIVGRDPRNGQQVKLIGNGSNSKMTLSYSGASNLQEFTMRDVFMDGQHGTAPDNGCIESIGDARREVTLVNCTLIGSEIIRLNSPALNTTNYNSSHVTLIDCDFSVTSDREVMVIRTGRVDVFGDNLWTRKNTVATTRALIWQISGGHFNIHSGASLIASTDYSFVYNNEFKSYFTVDGYFELNINMHNTLSKCYGMTNVENNVVQKLESLIIGSAGHLRISHSASAANINFASLYADNLTVKEGGRLEIYTQASGMSCFRGTTVDINLPEFVIMEHNADNRAVFYLDTNGSVTLKTSVINAWQDGSKHIWNNADLKPFTVFRKIGTNAASTVTGLETGFSGVNSGAALPGQSHQLTGATFDITGTNGHIQRLVLADYGVRINPETAYSASPSIAGFTPPGFKGTIEVREYAMNRQSSPPALGNGGVPLQTVQLTIPPQAFHTGTNGGNAFFTNASNRVYALCARTDIHSPYAVEAHLYQDMTQKLELVTVPSSLSFGTVPISGKYKLLDPEDGTEISVFNSYIGKSWTLSASATDMVSASDTTLAGGLVFVDPANGELTFLTEEVVIAKRSQNDPVEKTIAWETGQGLLLQLDPYAGMIDETYTATITWTLTLDDTHD